MEHRTDILNELKELSPVLGGMEKLNVFTVTNGYFENLSELILSSVNLEEKSIINNLSKQNSSSVREGYFDHLADNILSRIKALENETAANELRALSPMLYSIQNENVFDIPNGYFNTLSDDINAKIQPLKSKLTVVHSRSSVFMKYAVAAAFTGVMALTVFKFTASSSILDAAVINGLKINKEHSFDKEFANVSDEEIIRYLDAHGDSVDAQTLADNTLDENELPSQADYLSDEKALDNYLDNNINSNF